MKYYVFINTEGVTYRKPTAYTDVCELAAAQETNDGMLRSGTKDELIQLYGLVEEDFVDEGE